MGYGVDQTGTPPFFVVTHAPPQDVRLERELGMRFTFVSDLAAAIDQARAAATHGDVVIMGGGDVIGQALEQGLVEELRIHLAPMLLGGGTPLFKPGTRQMYRQREIRPSNNAVHLAYERVDQSRVAAGCCLPLAGWAVARSAIVCCSSVSRRAHLRRTTRSKQPDVGDGQLESNDRQDQRRQREPRNATNQQHNQADMHGWPTRCAAYSWVRGPHLITPSIEYLLLWGVSPCTLRGCR